MEVRRESGGKPENSRNLAYQLLHLLLVVLLTSAAVVSRIADY